MLPSAPDTADARDEAFDALLPIAALTESAVDRVQATIEDERKLLGVLREPIHVSQRAALDGLARFAHGVRLCGEEWEECPLVTRVSTPKQEAGGVYLWLLADRYVIRIKHEPVVPRVDPGVLRLTSELPPSHQLIQVYFTWDISLDGRIVRPAFVCLDEPAWTIPLSELAVHVGLPPVPVPTERRVPVVRSTRPKKIEQDSKEKPGQDER